MIVTHRAWIVAWEDHSWIAFPVAEVVAYRAAYTSFRSHAYTCTVVIPCAMAVADAASCAVVEEAGRPWSGTWNPVAERLNKNPMGLDQYEA